MTSDEIHAKLLKLTPGLIVPLNMQMYQSFMTETVHDMKKIPVVLLENESEKN